MNPYRQLRSLVGGCLRANPWTRGLLTSGPNYQVITLQEARRQRKIAWHSVDAAARQDAAYRALIRQMRDGAPRIDLTIAAQAVDQAGLAAPSLLEIGCGSGYYSEILGALAKSNVGYTGIDYSAAMIEKAKKCYPSVTFEIGDATALRFGDASFDIVFNGVSLMHILDYEEAIAESARVARKAAIFHSTPVFADHPTTFLRKKAYGGAMVEAVFNRDELLRCFARHGLHTTQSWNTIEYNVGAAVGSPSHAETFFCEKAS